MHRLAITFALMAGFSPEFTAAAAADETILPTWTLRVTREGRTIETLEIPAESELEKSVEERATLLKGARRSLDTYAPSVVVESELKRANFLADAVVIEFRKTPKERWSQRVRKATDEDRALRKKLLGEIDRMNADAGGGQAEAATVGP